MYFPEVVTWAPIVAVPVKGSAFATIAVSPLENVTVSVSSNSLVVAVYFKRGAVKSITVPVAPLMFDVNVSSADIVPETVLRTA